MTNIKKYVNAYYSVQFPLAMLLKEFSRREKKGKVDFISYSLEFNCVSDEYDTLEELKVKEKTINRADIISTNSSKILDVQFTRYEEWETINSDLYMEYCYPIWDDARLSNLVDDINTLLFKED